LRGLALRIVLALGLVLLAIRQLGLRISGAGAPPLPGLGKAL
jgi:hypothetical protein